MHHCRYLILVILLAPLTISAQQKAGPGDITGLWKGTLYNDSTGQYYRYEIAITENKGKLSGFSHTWFLFGDKRYFGLKKVKVKKAGNGKIIIEDNGLVTNNYPIEPAKNVRQLNILTLSVSDESMILEGPFSTNATKQYASLTGNINLSKKQDYWQSDLVPHLQELGLIPNLSFVQNDLAIIAAPKITTNLPGNIEKVPGITEENESKITADTNTGIIFPVKNLDNPGKLKDSDVAVNVIAKAGDPRNDNTIIKQDDNFPPGKKEDFATHQQKNKSQNEREKLPNIPVEKEEQPPVKNVSAENKTATGTVKVEETKSQNPAPVIKQNNPVVKTEPIKATIVAVTPPPLPPQAVVKAEGTIKPKVLNVEAPASTEKKSAALLVNARSNIIQQTVLFSSDSLQLSLFDNGEVDGDTVSVLMDGEVIIAKQRLSTNAFRQTIYLDKNQDNIELLMYAENLGSIPPNTGLLVVKDGKDIYEIRFRGDYEKNAAIILKRKR